MRRAILDANVLVLLVVGAVDTTLILKHKRTQVFAEEGFETLTRYLEQYLVLQVTPHALAEASNLLAQTDCTTKPLLLHGLRVLLKTLVEVFVPSEQACGNASFDSLGLTDATLAEAVAAGGTLVTVDLDLYLWLMAQSYDAVNFNHVRAGAW